MAPLFHKHDPSLRELISYLVQGALDRGAALTQTRLVKLLYLVDVERAASRRTPLTGLQWRFYHYGPYALELPETLQLMEPHEVRTRGGGDATLYIAAPQAPTGAEWPEPTRLLADHVLDEWTTGDLNMLLDYTYFETGPMRDAERGDLLDLTKSEPRRPYVSRRPPPADPAALARLKELAAGRRARLDDPAMAPTDGPFDEIWAEAMETERILDGDPVAGLENAQLLLTASVLDRFDDAGEP